MSVLPIAEAKKNFSAIVREASEGLRCFRIGNAQRHDAPRAVVLGESAVETLLECLECHPAWEHDEEQGLWSVAVPELGVFGQGVTKDSAVADLLKAAVDSAAAYLEDPVFFAKVARRQEYPFVLAVFLYADEPLKLRSFLRV